MGIEATVSGCRMVCDGCGCQAPVASTEARAYHIAALGNWELATRAGRDDDLCPDCIAELGEEEEANATDEEQDAA